MEQIVYADVLFIVNFSMDFLSLYITGKLLHNSAHIFALIMSSAIGGLYGVAALFLSGNSIINALINICVAMLICFISYGMPSILMLIRNTLIFYGIGFLMGGVMTGIFYMVNKGLCGRGIVIDGSPNTLTSDIPPGLLIASAVLAMLFSYICSAVMKKVKEVKKSDIYIRIADKEANFTGICDSGNLLTEPGACLPCLICNLSVIKKLVPIGILPIFSEKKLGILEFADPFFASRIKLIPMHTVGGSGIIVGIIPDEVKINGQSKRLCVACDPDTPSFSDTESIIPSSVM